MAETTNTDNRRPRLKPPAQSAAACLPVRWAGQACRAARGARASMGPVSPSPVARRRPRSVGASAYPASRREAATPAATPAAAVTRKASAASTRHALLPSHLQTSSPAN